MSVTVLVPGVLRGDADNLPRLELGVHGTLADVMADITTQWPRLSRRICDEQGALRTFVNVYVDGEDVRTRDGLETPVRESSTVILLPAMAGGC